MFGLALLLIGIVLLLAPFAFEALADKREQKCYTQKLALRRYHIGLAPESPTSFEHLGDAMREAGHLEEAIASYQISKEMAEKQGGNAGAGYFAGAGIDNKIRLTRIELQAERTPEQVEATLRTRPPVCSKCGHVGFPGDKDCQSCHAPLPTDSFFDTMKHKTIRAEILKETATMLSGWFIIAAALWLISGLPDIIRITVVVVSCFVIPLRLLKRVGPDSPID
jgi:hypothetical protein